MPQHHWYPAPHLLGRVDYVGGIVRISKLLHMTGSTGERVAKEKRWLDTSRVLDGHAPVNFMTGMRSQCQDSK